MWGQSGSGWLGFIPSKYSEICDLESSDKHVKTWVEGWDMLLKYHGWKGRVWKSRKWEK